jgi:hypothetical protein
MPSKPLATPVVVAVVKPRNFSLKGVLQQAAGRLRVHAASAPPVAFKIVPVVENVVQLKQFLSVFAKWRTEVGAATCMFVGNEYCTPEAVGVCWSIADASTQAPLAGSDIREPAN